MPKLKALRGAIGSYGRVAAGGIIDVDEASAEKLLKTRRFVRATAEDIAAAQAAQERFLRLNPSATAAFSPVPTNLAPTDAAADASDDAAKAADETQGKAEAGANAKAAKGSK